MDWNQLSVPKEGIYLRLQEKNTCFDDQGVTWNTTYKE
jgi:hypothetical protein